MIVFSVVVCCFCCVCFVFFCFLFFFFSSRRRHTRCLSDWSSDVCSSDLPSAFGIAYCNVADLRGGNANLRSEERRVGKGVDLGGRRIIKKKKKRKDEWTW